MGCGRNEFRSYFLFFPAQELTGKIMRDLENNMP